MVKRKGPQVAMETPPGKQGKAETETAPGKHFKVTDAEIQCHVHQSPLTDFAPGAPGKGQAAETAPGKEGKQGKEGGKGQAAETAPGKEGKEGKKGGKGNAAKTAPGKDGKGSQKGIASLRGKKGDIAKKKPGGLVIDIVDPAALQNVPVQGLTGASAKERKLLRSAHRMSKSNPKDRAGALGPSSMAPPPRICNRCGDCEFSSGGSGCECTEWPNWLLFQGLPSGRAKAITDVFEGNILEDPVDGKNLPAKPGSTVAYLRSGGKKGFHYYNGLVGGVWKVVFPTGKERIVVQIN